MIKTGRRVGVGIIIFFKPVWSVCSSEVCIVSVCVSVCGVSLRRMLRCICPQFDKVYQSALSSVVNASGRLPREAKEYERYLQEVSQPGCL